MREGCLQEGVYLIVFNKSIAKWSQLLMHHRAFFLTMSAVSLFQPETRLELPLCSCLKYP